MSIVTGIQMAHTSITTWVKINNLGHSLCYISFIIGRVSPNKLVLGVNVATLWGISHFFVALCQP